MPDPIPVTPREPTASERAASLCATPCPGGVGHASQPRALQAECGMCLLNALRSAELAAFAGGFVQGRDPGSYGVIPPGFVIPPTAAEVRAVTRLVEELVSGADGWRSAPAVDPAQRAFNEQQAWRGQSAAFVVWHISSVRPTCPPPELPGDDPAELAAARRAREACVDRLRRRMDSDLAGQEAAGIILALTDDELRGSP